MTKTKIDTIEMLTSLIFKEATKKYPNNHISFESAKEIAETIFLFPCLLKEFSFCKTYFLEVSK